MLLPFARCSAYVVVALRSACWLATCDGSSSRISKTAVLTADRAASESGFASSLAAAASPPGLPCQVLVLCYGAAQR
jgi:hypothetical protein